MNNELKIGWSEVSITPDQSISLAGQFFERISEYVETPITVTAMAVECGGEQMIICSADLCVASIALLNDIRQYLRKNYPQVPAEKVLVHATHSHTSHVYDRGSEVGCAELDILLRFMPEDMIYKPLSSSSDVMTPAEARVYLTEKIAQAAAEAWDNMKPAVYACGFGRAAVGQCRRVCYDDGSAKMWGDSNSPNFVALEGGNDSGIEILYTFDTEKNITGAVINVACPSQVVEHRSFVSSDYWGKVKMYLREKFGENLFVLGLCSAAGDQSPRDLIRWVNPDTPIDDPNIERNYYREKRADVSMFDIQGTYRIGRRIATEVIAAFDEIDEYFSEPVFIHETRKLNMPVRRVTITEYENAVKAIEDFVSANRGRKISFKDTAAMYVHSGTIERFEYQRLHEVYPIEVHFIRFGDIAFASSPFELFLDYGNQIRARSFAKQTFLIQLCCGADGYLPTEKAEKGSHYSAYVSTGITGHAGGEILVRETLEAINAMWKE